MSNIQRRPNGRWRARYRAPNGKEHATKAEAQRWLDEQASGLVTGRWLGPALAIDMGEG